ncbi:MAG: GAK system CofD-like protein [Myxococcota bacterium]|jgi:CofD-related protein of GAK system|nr:GAK system CofD-like protein [Myxococcota bacterium]
MGVKVPIEVQIRRAARVPDPARLDRYLRAPELGPKILFFSGGSALAKTSRELKRYTHNSIHLMTAFDSGGSSAEIRRAFRVLSVGDLRQRMMSLADETARGNPEIFRLFSYRLPEDRGANSLGVELDALVSGEHELVRCVPGPLRRLVRTHLREFQSRMPSDFDLRRASIGNLVIMGGLLANEGDIDAVLFLFSKLVEVRGQVLPITSEDVEIAATLDSGDRVVGQHRLTGKNEPPIESRIRQLDLVRSMRDDTPVEVRAADKVCRLIREADLICFPTGSFYSSVLANLLVRGVGRAIAEAPCSKVFIPNMGCDPEQVGMTLGDCIETLIAAVRRDAGEDTPVARILDLVALDSRGGAYETPLDLPRAKEVGVEVLDLDLVRDNGWPLIDAHTLARCLLSLA